MVFDLGGVVFRWQLLVLLQELLLTRAPNETEASKWASAILQILHPEGYWALFDLGLIEPEPLAQRIALRTGLAESDLRHLIANIAEHLRPIQGTVDLRQPNIIVTAQACWSLQGTPVLWMMFSTTAMPQLHMAGNRIGLKRPSKCGLRWLD